MHPNSKKAILTFTLLAFFLSSSLFLSRPVLSSCSYSQNLVFSYLGILCFFQPLLSCSRCLCLSDFTFLTSSSPHTHPFHSPLPSPSLPPLPLPPPSLPPPPVSSPLPDSTPPLPLPPFPDSPIYSLPPSLSLLSYCSLPLSSHMWFPYGDILEVT